MSWAQTIYLKNFIQGEKRFVASDATLASAIGNKFHSKLNGMVRIKFEGKRLVEM